LHGVVFNICVGGPVAGRRSWNYSQGNNGIAAMEPEPSAASDG